MRTLEREKQVKIFVSREDHKRIRIAAAIQGTTVSAYCRRVVLQMATHATKALALEPGTADEAALSGDGLAMH